MHVCVCVDMYISIRTVRQLLWILALVLVGSLYTPTVTKPADLSSHDIKDTDEIAC